MSQRLEIVYLPASLIDSPIFPKGVPVPFTRFRAIALINELVGAMQMRDMQWAKQAGWAAIRLCEDGKRELLIDGRSTYAEVERWLCNNRQNASFVVERVGDICQRWLGVPAAIAA